jgi:hypothetical protein
VISNAAYSALWGHDPAANLGADAGLGAMTAYWESKTAPDPIWSEAEAFIASTGVRERWEATTRMTDGRLIRCRFVPLAGGATLAGFTPGLQEARPRLTRNEKRKAAAAGGTA